jgi:7,8-dihydropterin-6-yl-methyl-4-(beta-D-ribofuranosyl)aminobenzene 5'-phosphate synthase
MRITTLIENECVPDRDDLVAEFGLSLHIEAGGARILFDTGASPTFVENAQRLGIDLSAVELGVLSHHHYDHGGGLEAFLTVNSKALVFLKDAELARRQLRALGFLRKSVGIDTSLLDRFPERFRTISEETQISPGITLLTTIPHDSPRPAGNRHLFVVREDGTFRDSFDHELTMVVEENGGLVVFTGCSHNGILNMIEGVVRRFPGHVIRAVFGGFHLIGLPFFNTMTASREEVRELARRLPEVPVERVFTGHCTGRRAFAVLKDVLGDRLHGFPTGSVIEF